MTPEMWKKVSDAWEEYFNLPPDNRATFPKRQTDGPDLIDAVLNQIDSTPHRLICADLKKTRSGLRQCGP